MAFNLSRFDPNEHHDRLALYESAKPLFSRLRWGRMTEAELIMREARLTRLRDEENFTTEKARQLHRIYLVYNEEVADHEAAVLADVKKRSIEAKAEIIKAMDRQDAKVRAEELIVDPLEVREVHDKIDLIYSEPEPVPVTSQPGSANGHRNPPKAQKPPEKESIV
jgi:hypothetical protein